MKKLNIIYVATGATLFLVLLLLTLLRQDVPFWDEAYYLENVQILKDLGFTIEFLINYKGPAGPTFALIHYLLSPLTNLQAPYVRLVNIMFLLFSIVLIYKITKRVNGKDSIRTALAISALSIPTVYTITGMALTEMFGVFFLLIFIYILINAYKENKNSWILALFAGLALSLAILSRQPILMILLALPIFVIDYDEGFKIDFKNKKFTIFICISFLSSLIIPLTIFSVWGNIQPASHAITGAGLAPKHLILALGYTALYVLFINPTFFNIKKDISNKSEFLLVSIVPVLANIFLLKVSIAPFATIISNLITNKYLELYSLVCGSLLTSLGLLFLYYFIKKQMLQSNKLIMFLSLAFLLIIATSVKVTHQFSARYVAQAFPLLILAVNYNREKIKIIDIITLIIGGLLGIISLESYFLN